MPELRLQQNIDYTMEVTKVANAAKNFRKTGESQLSYQHDIYFKDANGNAYKGEYISYDAQQGIFNEGRVAVFRVRKAWPKGDEIEPVGNPETWSAQQPGSRPSPQINTRISAIHAASRIVASKQMGIEGPLSLQVENELFTLADKINAWINNEAYVPF